MLEQLLAFTETAKRGSFAAAARELGVTSSTIAKAVGRLELNLGLRLFQRTTRQVTLTSDGERLFARCQKVISDLEEIKAEALGTDAAPSGTLRVNLPIVFGRMVVLPILVNLISQHSELKLDVRLSDAFADIVNDGIDLAVRIGALPDSSLIARKIGSQQWILCTSPIYLKKRGVPQTLAELSTHAAVLFRMPTTGRDQVWYLQDGLESHVVQPQTRFRCSDGEAMTEVVRLGFGIAQLPDYMVREFLADGSLVEILRPHKPPSTPIFAVMPAGRMIPARVRVLLAALVGLASVNKGASS
jgi:LysR family transcriptional regulator, regulator for bpeEF and oprC